MIDSMDEYAANPPLTLDVLRQALLTVIALYPQTSDIIARYVDLDALHSPAYGQMSPAFKKRLDAAMEIACRLPPPKSLPTFQKEIIL